MSDEIRDYTEYRKLREEYYSSEGIRQYNAFLSNQLSFYTFDSNYRELLLAVRRHFQLRVERKLGDWNDKKPLHDYLNEVTRLLHNFLASAKTLVDHTRFFVCHTYTKPSVAHLEYQAEVDKRFSISQINKFTLDLRTYLTHISMPFISSVMGGSKATGRDLFTLQLDINKMGHSERWSRESREYIRSCDGTVDLELYLIEYYKLIHGFYTWLGPKVEEWGKEAADAATVIEQKLIRFEMRSEGKKA